MAKLLVAILVGSMMLAPLAVEAKSVTARKAIVVGKAALYGLGGGLVIGLASQVVKKRAKNIFVGGSLGMYAGIITGLYLVVSAGSNDSREYEGPDTYEDFSGWDSRIAPAPRETLQAQMPKDDKLVELTFFQQAF